MFIHYDEVKIQLPDGKVAEITNFVFSSYVDEPKVDQNIHYTIMKKLVAFLKQIPPQDRAYDPKTNVWTIPTKSFKVLVNTWIAATYVQQSSMIFHNYLLATNIGGGHIYGTLSLFMTLSIGAKQVKQASARWPNPRQQTVYGTYGFNDTPETLEEASKNAPKIEDFFYQDAQPASSSPSISLAQLKLVLSALLEEPSIEGKDLKKLYRRAAMKCHPDRNNGDGTKMSELNFYYQQYTKLVGA